MKPQQIKIEYEKIKTDEFVVGMIEEILYEKEHLWQPYQGKAKDPSEAVRFVFTVDGYKFPHKTPWLTFSYGEKAKLYQKYIVPLVEGASPNFDFDLDQLRGLRVKMLWVDKGEFQGIETIRPANGKKVIPIKNGITKDPDESEVPF